jgi:hypothetical protein
LLRAVLGFEAKDPPLLHVHEEHEQGLMLVDKWPSARRASRLLPKAFKKRKQQLDIVGKGWCDHGRVSWRVWQLSFQKRPAGGDYVNALCTPLS